MRVCVCLVSTLHDVQLRAVRQQIAFQAHQVMESERIES